MEDVLHRPYFQSSRVVAGHEGLDNVIKWPHIVEIEKFGHLLNGQEFILTTGVSWDHNHENCLNYLQQLIDHDASALCVELGTYIKNIPPKMCQLADQHQFPIITFSHEVKFVDITKDIQEMVLGYEQKMWLTLEEIYKSLNKALLNGRKIGDFLRILHKYTNKSVTVVLNDGQSWFFPPIRNETKREWLNNIANDKKNVTSQPLTIFQEEIGNLYVLESKEQVNRFDSLALGRCAAFINQYIWNQFEKRAVRTVPYNLWILDAIKGKLSHQEVVEELLQLHPYIRLGEAMIGIVPTSNDKGSQDNEEHKQSVNYVMMNARGIFTQSGFYFVTAMDLNEHYLIILLINQHKSSSLFYRLTKSVKQLKRMSRIDKITSIKWISFGKTVENYHHLKESYKTAISTLTFQNTYLPLEKPYYKQLHVYRIIDQLKNTKELQEIIEDYIGSLIRYDQDHNGNLLLTLHSYLKNMGSKKETAEELYIVRQTLYHRLTKIKELLGDDFMLPENRIMIEFTIYAYHYQGKMEQTGDLPSINP